MDRGVAVILMACTGGLIALQPAINAGLSKQTGTIAAAFISFAVGALLLAVVVAVSGQASGLSSTFDVRWYYLLGGVVGAVWIATSLIAVKSLGAGGVVAATVTGQLTGAVIADRLGVLGLAERAITPARIAGVCLLIVGTYLVVR
jgi:bacterial/archaeal transporter family-2 protein